VSCQDYEGVMLVLCTPLQVKCYRKIITVDFLFFFFILSIGLWKSSYDFIG